MNTYERLVKFIEVTKVKCEIVDVNAIDLSIEAHVKALGIRYMDGMGALLMKDKKGMYYCILRRDDRNLDLKKLKGLLEVKKLSMVKEDELSDLGYEVGLMAPILLKSELGDKVQFIVDAKLKEVDEVYCGVGHEKKAMKIKLEEFLKVVGGYKVLDFTVVNPSRVDGVDNSSDCLDCDENLNKDLKRKRILTGDRPTGRLHIGHYVGTLRNRVKLQDEYETFILIANIHALADNADNPEFVMKNVKELLKDYYAVGLDFEKTTVYLQSEAPIVHEIFMYLANHISVQQLMHNPTLKTEIKQNSMDKSTPLGFFVYPVHQAADILMVNADLVPVGKDQAPILEDTRKLVRKFNKQYKTEVLNEPVALIGSEHNLVGLDGKAKMSKSLNNCIYLGDSEDVLRKKVFSAYTDPNRIHAIDPGKVEGNVVFTYLDEFATDMDEVEDLKARYRAGTVGDVEVKQRLFEIMNEVLTPIRKRRVEAEDRIDYLMDMLISGSKKVNDIARGIADGMKDAMKIGV